MRICINRKRLLEAEYWYTLHKNKRIYTKNRLAERKAMMYKALGGICVKCGPNNDLEVDHINNNDRNIRTVHDRASGKAGLSAYYLTGREYLGELPNCQLLCRFCHHEKTMQERAH